MRGSVDSIKERLDIVEVISSYIKLEKAGQNYKGKCPFHNEKTASFSVSPIRQGYYCFGCNAKGDIFTFVQEIEGIDFRAALKQLAEKAGIPLIKEDINSREKKTEKDKIYSSLEDAADFFENNLKANPEAKLYLEKRGINENSIKSFRIGYALNDWRKLFDHLIKIGYTKEILLKAGLIKQGEDKNKEPYDIFRGRLIFPLLDINGRVIAFSGRALLDDIIPKYLNTPETILFSKSEVLYGLDKAKEDIRKKNFTILVEGQMDLVLSHQAGIKNTVASSGTAFTQTHLERLKRLSSRILLAFDGDSAGKKAAYKSTVLGLYLGMEVKIASIPDKSDPADIIKENSELWKNILRESVHSIEYFLNKIIEEEKDSRKIGKEIEKNILPLINLLQSVIERSHFVSLISKKIGLKEEIIWEDLKKTPKTDMQFAQETKQEKDKIQSEEIIKRPRKSHIERRLIGIIFWQKTLTQPSIDIASLESEINTKVGTEYFSTLIENLNLEKEALIFEAESYYTSGDRLSKDIVELLDNLTSDLLAENLNKIAKELLKAENEKNDKLILELSNKIQAIHNQMLSLEQKRKML